MSRKMFGDFTVLLNDLPQISSAEKKIFMLLRNFKGDKTDAIINCCEKLIRRASELILGDLVAISETETTDIQDKPKAPILTFGTKAKLWKGSSELLLRLF